MPTKLSLPQQRALIRALPASRKNAVKRHCQTCSMRGDGFMDILKSVGKVLGPIVKEIGPTILKEFVVPFIKKKVSGGGVRLAGQGKKRKKPASYYY